MVYTRNGDVCTYLEGIAKPRHIEGRVALCPSLTFGQFQCFIDRLLLNANVASFSLHLLSILT